MTGSRCQVAIIGGGPSGLAAAIRLKQLGAGDVRVIERDSQAGGIPRHCGHSAFGMREIHRVLSGPKYASQLVSRAKALGVEICLNTSVTGCANGGELTLSSVEGETKLQAEKVIICTGNRETPRSARLVSGSRPTGVVTTGALQSMVYLKGRRPFVRPVVIGTEMISFSALLTCRHAKIKPVAMIETGNRLITMQAAALLPRLMGVPLHLNATLESIHGHNKVDAVEVKYKNDQSELIACDGVIFSGQFVSESSLVRCSHLEMDSRSGGPLVDQYNRCSDPCYFACGNLLHPVDTAGWCWMEGRKVASFVFAELQGLIPKTHRHISINACDDAIKYFTPQKIALAGPGTERRPIGGTPELQIRFNTDRRGQLSLSDEQALISAKSVSAIREKRHLFALPDTGKIEKSEILSLRFRA